MRIVVDRQLCQGHGQCEFAAPLVQMEAIDGSMPYVVGGVGL